MSKWIWRFSDFEIYHNRLVHNRRLEYGYQEAPVWKIHNPESAVRFRKTVTLEEAGDFQITACGYYVVTIKSREEDAKKLGGVSVVHLPPGVTHISITVSNAETFPALFVSGAVSSDSSWVADDLTEDAAPVGTYRGFDTPDKRPDVFPFCYETLHYVRKEHVNNGTLFDFGRETFARTTFLSESDSDLFVTFGESREEALDTAWSVIQMKLHLTSGQAVVAPNAFRYIYVDSVNTDVCAEYEYLPLPYRGSFQCSDPVLNRVWDTAAYTFHLCSREFFLDGIKRDRWVWSADAYQSLFVNRYLFLDADIEQRTLIALGGKTPVKQHINTIMDYSSFWILSIFEHYQTYGDQAFLEQIYPQAREYVQFCRNRADSDGFLRQQPGDWIFIDWAPMDKTGALCGEQVLFAKALECFGAICAIIGKSDEGCSEQAQMLQAKVIDQFYDRERQAFIDSYESGEHNVSRQCNILAYLFLPLDDDMKSAIYQNVVLNDEVRQITTPYFKFYENQVHCEAGNFALLEKSIRDYYGSMLDTGATSLYEEYDPTASGVEHYAMYGNPYQKSLCHAWSASPIYLFGRYCLGVTNTGVGFDTFEVSPALGELRFVSGTVPVASGTVSVSMDSQKVVVLSTVAGGTLIHEGNRIPLAANQEYTLPVGAP